MPNINRETFFKDTQRLFTIGVLSTTQKSQYGTPIFIIPKKEVTMRFILDYHYLNHKIVRNPHPLPRIGEMMQKMEGLQYYTSLNLNMGYYTMEISPEICHLTTIVTYFGKFSYNRVPMVLCGSGDIFQSKLDDLIGDIKGFNRYIDYILVLGKGSLSQHIYHIIVIFDRLRTAGLKLNDPK